MSSQSTDDSLRIFLSYAREDYNAVSAIYDRLKDLGLKPWMDKRDILPGQRWREIIPREVQRSDFVLVCLSPHSVDKRGFFQREIRTALYAWEDRLQDDIYLIPVRLEACEVAGELREFQWVDLYEEDGWDMLIRAFRVGAERLGRPMPGWPELAPEQPSELSKHVETSPVEKVTAAEEGLPDLITIDTPIYLELVRVSSGEFLMGSDPDEDGDAIDDELPQHTLFLPAFYIAKTPVTNEQYAVFKGGFEVPRGKEDHPVVNVTWHDATDFCRWLSEQTGRVFRLPTEAEWEKAARGTDGRIWPWGNERLTPERCNFNNNVGDTTSVGEHPKGASPYGVLDMVGNVWEWTNSLWGEEFLSPEYRYPYNPTDGRENQDAPDNVVRVVRGGSFDYDAISVRCASRGRGVPTFASDNNGLRVCAGNWKE